MSLPPLPPATGRVLLVEDDLLNQEVTREVLELISLQVHLAVDGHEAVAMARREAFDLIVLDLHMPGMNGLQAAREIRAESLNATTPILALTADVATETERSCTTCGIDEVLHKPVSIDVLCERVSHWLAHPRPAGMR